MYIYVNVNVKINAYLSKCQISMYIHKNTYICIYVHICNI